MAKEFLQNFPQSDTTAEKDVFLAEPKPSFICLPLVIFKMSLWGFVTASLVGGRALVSLRHAAERRGGKIDINKWNYTVLAAVMDGDLTGGEQKEVGEKVLSLYDALWT